MKRTHLLHPTKTMATAITCAMALAAAPNAAVAADSEVAQLRTELAKLQARLEALEAAKPDGDIARLQVKQDAMETAHTEAGLGGLKISGMIDPTYIASSNRRSAGFNFLNNFDGQDRSAAGQDSMYAFDNSFFGMMLLQFDKESENGTKWRLQLVPHKSSSSAMNLGSIIHEATVSFPTENKELRVLAGQFADFTGYEYFLSHQTKMVTHNLLFDFTQPSYYVGGGVEWASDGWTTKALLANMNKSSHGDRSRNPILVFRTDRVNSEFSGFGVTGQLGKYMGQRLAMLSSDAYYTRGAWSLNGQVNVGAWRNSAFNGGDAGWAGVSLLGGYKLTPRLELTARGDYLKNDKNGGGTIATVFTGCSDGVGMPVSCSDASVAYAGAGDSRNGLGPTEGALAAAVAAGKPGAVQGTNRSALTLGGNYTFNENILLKFEYRYDRANQAVFLKQPALSYQRSNSLLAASVVATF